MRITKAIAAVGAASLLALSLAACASDNSSSGDSSGKSITIGIKFDQPGVGFKDGSKYTGFDVDVANYVAKDLGYTDVTFKEAKSADRETLLQSGQVDMIFASYTINEERQQKVSFAGPYLVAGQDLLVRSDDTAITGPDSLNGKKLCSVTGSTSAQNVKTKFANEVQLQNYDSYSKCLPALLSGNIDALTTDDDILAGYAAQSQYKGKLKVVGQPFTEEPYGVGIKKGNTDLCKKIDTALTKMVDSGDWKKALTKNFGDANYTPDSSKNPPKQIACS